MLNRQQVAAFSASFPQISADAELLDALSSQAIGTMLGRGQTICHQGDNCSHLALVIAGTARVFNLAESGREITLYRVEPGECCILTASCMLSGRTFPANATVEADIEAVLIPQPQVSAWMSAHETWRHYLWNLLAERLGDVISLVEEVAFRRMDKRLGDYLVQHARQKGPLLQATHQQIAADLGTSREVVSRMLKDFQLRGFIASGRGRIELLDLDSLGSIGHESD